MANTFQIKSPYSKKNGISILINSIPLNLQTAEVCYLLIDVDGAATSPTASPDKIKFSLYNVDYEFTNEEWSVFFEELQSYANVGGWSHLDCTTA